MDRSVLRRWLRPRYELTEDELILRFLFTTTRIPRAEIDYAKFEWTFLGGSQLWIHLRNGHIVKERMQPRWTSTELSGDPALPGSAAYEITEWAGESTT